MRAMFSLRRPRFVARIGTLLIAIALVGGVLSCGGGGAPTRYDLTMAADPSAGGAVTDETGGSPYSGGTTISIKAEANPGYKFAGWTASAGGFADANAEETTFTMPAQDVTVTANFEGEEVTFADDNLEAAVREAIGKPTGPIYASDLDGLTSLDAEDKSIADLTGLECATSLTLLYLESNQISDISPLANLASLTELWLYDNQISDIEPLVNLTGLTLLRLYKNEISDISPLANLTSLPRVNLSQNQISDISHLANLTSLTELWLYDNQISDIEPLVNLTSLTELSLGENEISDISPLADLTSLTYLNLNGNQISDMSPLADLTSLYWLGLSDSQTSDISLLANLTNLDYLDLDSNQISDIEPLVNNPGLSAGDSVSLNFNPLSATSLNTYIPQLEARGVEVYYYSGPAE